MVYMIYTELPAYALVLAIEPGITLQNTGSHEAGGKLCGKAAGSGVVIHYNDLELTGALCAG